MTSAPVPAHARIVDPRLIEQRIPAELSATRWTGPTDVRRAHEALGSQELLINVVYLSAGTRSRPHSHSNEQVLIYTAGRGIVAVAGGEDEEVECGQLVLLPAGVAHMHGATAEGPACHVSIMAQVDMDFDCPIPDAWARWRA